MAGDLLMIQPQVAREGNVSLRRGSEEEETPRTRGGEDCFESVLVDSSTDVECFAAVTAAGRDEPSASEPQPQETRDLRESATCVTCRHELQRRADPGGTDQPVHESTHSSAELCDELKRSLKKGQSANPSSRQSSRRGVGSQTCGESQQPISGVG